MRLERVGPILCTFAMLQRAPRAVADEPVSCADVQLSDAGDATSAALRARIVARLAAELRASGLQPRVTPDADGVPATNACTAAIRIVTPTAVDLAAIVRVARPFAAPRTWTIALGRDRASAGDDPVLVRDLVVHVAELLHAELVPVPENAPTARSRIESEAAATPAAASPPPQELRPGPAVALGLGWALAHRVDGGNVGFPIARLDARLVGRWAARLVLAGLAPRERFGSDEAGVDVARTRVSAALTYDLVALGRGGVYVGAGVGSSSASVTGHTSADDLTRSSTFITALAEAVIGARLALGSRVAFVTEAAIRHELPRTRLFVLERAAAAAGGESLSLEAAVVVSL